MSGFVMESAIIGGAATVIVGMFRFGGKPSSSNGKLSVTQLGQIRAGLVMQELCDEKHTNIEKSLARIENTLEEIRKGD